VNFKNNNCTLNNKINSIKTKIIKIKDRNIDINNKVNTFLERVENTKIYSNNEMILSGYLDNKYDRLNEIVRDYELIKIKSENSYLEIEQGFNKWEKT